MIFDSTYKLEDFVLNLKWDELPHKVKEHSIMCAIDLFGALILGSYGSQYETGIKLSASMGMFGSIPLFRHRELDLNLLGASISYGHASNSFDIDDGHKQICGHPGASFIGGVLARALEENISYKEYLTTLVACYECTIRWAIAMQNHYSYLHSTGAYGAFGTAAGIGRIMQLSKDQLKTALSIADYHAPMTPVMRAVEYPSMNKDGVPFGSLIGCMSVLETLNGYTGKTHLLEMPEYRYLLDSLGNEYKILDLYYKPYTCCRWTHQPIKACLDLKQRYQFDNENVDFVEIHTFDAAAKLSKIKPKDTDEAQYNIAYPVACSLVYDTVGLNEIRTESVQNPKVLDMMDRLRFIVDEKLDSQFPEKRLAFVKIGLNDGSIVQSNIYEASGEPDDPELSLAWIQDKFRRITKPVIDANNQERIIKLLSECSDLPIRDIFNMINNSLN